MQRRLRRLAHRAAPSLRAALSLLLIGSLAGAPACSREGVGPAGAEVPSPGSVGDEAPEDLAADAGAGPGAEGLAVEGDPEPEPVRVASADLKALVAPVALYPDPLLELVL